MKRKLKLLSRLVSFDDAWKQSELEMRHAIRTKLEIAVLEIGEYLSRSSRAGRILIF